MLSKAEIIQALDVALWFWDVNCPITGRGDSEKEDMEAVHSILSRLEQGEDVDNDK